MALFRRTRERWHRMIASIFIALAVHIFASSASVADDTFSCLDELGGSIITFEGDQGYNNNDYFGIPDGTRVDARAATWFMQTDPPLPDGTLITYPIDIRMTDDNDWVCWAGGALHNTNDLDISWEESKVPNNKAFVPQYGGMILDGMRIHNAHDSLGVPYISETWTAPSFHYRNLWISYSRDDCIENDWMASGTIDDSLFDGCYVFLSATGTGIDGSNDRVIITNTLIHMEEMPAPFGHHDEPDLYAHGTIFKMHAPTLPQLELHNNIFLVEGIPNTRWDIDNWYHNAPGSLGFRDAVVSCSNNVIVWLGDGDRDGDFTDDDYPGNIPDDPNCVTVTRDISVWDQAKTRWLEEHPLVQRIKGVDDQDPVPRRAGSRTR